MWAGIVDDSLIGPYLLPPRLTRHTYFIFLQEKLGELLEDISLDICLRLWFQYDGPPPNFVCAIRDQLNRCFAQRWIGRGGPIG